MQRWEYCRIALDKSGDEAKFLLYTPEVKVRIFKSETFKDNPDIWELYSIIEGELVEDGWELFRESIHNSKIYYYFKRPITE